MPAKGNTYANDMLKLIFNAVPISGLADNAVTSPLTNLYVSLHTADPGAGGSQSTAEIAYTGYARVPAVRSAGGWTVTGNSVSPAAVIPFGTMTGGAGGVVTNFAVGTANTGAGKILYTGAVSPTITVNNGVQAQLSSSSAITES